MLFCRECIKCHKVLPDDYKNDICPNCKEIELFAEVKDFIRSNKVNEFQVAEHFNIPLKKVKGWIQEGRIEYVLDVNEDKLLTSLACLNCKTPVKSGFLCPECQRKRNQLKYGYTNLDYEDVKMRFLQNKK